MLENLFKLVQGESQQDIINNPAIPNEQNNQAVGIATDSIFSGLRGALANGGLQDVMGLFSGKSQANGSNPLVSGIMNSVVSGLMGKLGLNNGAASSIAGSLIPSILGKLINKTQDPSDSSFDMNGIMGSLLGGNNPSSGGVQIPGATQQQGIDFTGILGNLVKGGLDKNHDGSVGLGDLVGLIGGAAGNAQQNAQQQGGGVMDILSGFLK